jgi:shikimate dehydrogenase
VTPDAVAAAAQRRLPTRLVLLGAPVSHSLSPRFQNAALRAAGIPLQYEALHVEPAAFATTFAALGREGAAGNVTIPHKEAAAAACDELTPLARRVGAVNTFWRDGTRTIGDNTDVGGFAELARTVLEREPRGVRVLVLGAGGAAAAVLVAIAGWPGSTVSLHARTSDRAERLAHRLNLSCRIVADAAAAASAADVVVNATPVGLHDDAEPVPVDSLGASATVLDLVVRAGETAWVRHARARGLRAGGGLPMLVEQGALAFERWFGRAPDRVAMWRAVAG